MLLSDIAEIIMGQSPPGSAVNFGEGVPLLNGPTEFGPRHPIPVQFTTDPRKRALKGDLLFCVRGSTTGRMNWADQEYAIGRGIAAIRHKEDRRIQPFVRGVIESRISILLLSATGSTFPNVSAQQLSELPVPDFSSGQQRAIAHILGTLDDKIELNRRMNQTLEEMARAIYKDWFVDFGPVRAKLEGREPYLPPDLWDLFPDRLVDSELGEIPEGWEVKALGDCIDVARGLSYKGSGLSSDGMAMHNLNSVYEGGGYKYDGIKFYKGAFQERHKTRPGDVLVANTEQGHDRLLIGFAAIVPEHFSGDELFSHHLYRIRPTTTSGISAQYICQMLNTREMHDMVSGYATGTTVNMLPMDSLRLPKVVLPTGQLVTAFTGMAKAARSKQQELFKESRYLAEQRDVLLPRLVSGEVRVGEIMLSEEVSK